MNNIPSVFQVQELQRQLGGNTDAADAARLIEVFGASSLRIVREAAAELLADKIRKLEADISGKPVRPLF